MSVVAWGETPSLTGEFIGETHSVLERTQSQPPGNQHRKGPICLWKAREMTESQIGIVPSQTPPPQTVPQHSEVDFSTLGNT